MKRYYLFTGLLLAAVLSCSPIMLYPARAEAAPPAVCSVCNMNIEESNKRFSVVDAKSNEKAAFDDIGCALIWREELCASKLMSFESNAEVFDYNTAESVAIENASFVVESGVKTPMGYDIIAFRDKQSAERFVAEAGKGNVVPYSKLSVPKRK